MAEKRAFLFVVVFMISVGTGEIPDYSSDYCHKCKADNGLHRESDGYKMRRELHAQYCEIDSHGFSEELEPVATVEIFGRSIEK